MEQEESKDKTNTLIEKLKRVEKILGEPLVAYITIKDGDCKIKNILTKTFLEDDGGSDAVAELGLSDSIKDKFLKGADYFG